MQFSLELLKDVVLTLERFIHDIQYELILSKMWCSWE